jgi:hypothetical protein
MHNCEAFLSLTNIVCCETDPFTAERANPLLLRQHKVTNNTIASERAIYLGRADAFQRRAAK